jgi:hypothetical protein
MSLAVCCTGILSEKAKAAASPRYAEAKKMRDTEFEPSLLNPLMSGTGW